MRAKGLPVDGAGVIGWPEIRAHVRPLMDKQAPLIFR